MNKILHILFFFILLVIFSSCTSIVRFSSDKYKPKEQPNKSTTASNQKEKSNDSDNKTKNKFPQQSNLETSEIRLKILKEAENWIGTPYRYGGNSQSGADCSGFVQSVYLTVGIALPRTSKEQYDYSEAISIGDAQIGDLIFFKRKGKISHVGIISGNGEMIHASSSRGVIRQSIEEYLRSNIYAGSGRVISTISKN